MTTNTDTPATDLSWLIPSTSQEAVALSAVAEQPVKRFRKEIAHTGVFNTPRGKVTITADTLKHWADTHGQLAAAGVVVPVRVDDHSGEGAGKVEQLEVLDNRLFATLSIEGDNALAALKAGGVSLFSPAEYADHNGNKFVRPIRHVALTDKPVIKDLGEFVQLSEEVAVYTSTDQHTHEISITDGQHTHQLDPVRPAVDPVMLSMAADGLRAKLDAQVGKTISAATRNKLADLLIGKDNQALALSFETGSADLAMQIIAVMADNVVLPVGNVTGAQAVVLSDTQEPDANKVWESSRKRLGLTQ